MATQTVHVTAAVQHLDDDVASATLGPAPGSGKIEHGASTLILGAGLGSVIGVLAEGARACLALGAGRAVIVVDLLGWDKLAARRDAAIGPVADAVFVCLLEVTLLCVLGEETLRTLERDGLAATGRKGALDSHRVLEDSLDASAAQLVPALRMETVPCGELLAAHRALLHGVETLEEVADLALQGQDADHSDDEEVLPAV